MQFRARPQLHDACMKAYVVRGEPLNMFNNYVKYGIPYQIESLPFYSWNPLKNHSMEAVKSGVKGK